MRSAGQDWAVGQISELVAATAGKFEILESAEPSEADQNLTLTVSIDCRDIRRRGTGIALKVRERIRVKIPAAFPLKIPRAYFAHKRYAGAPHVQWGDFICLYQAPDVEWNPGRGMFGFLQRLHEWLKAASMGELDPIGMPLHPPVAYSVGYFCIVPQQNTPAVMQPYWLGYAEVTRENKFLVELGRWIERTEQIPDSRLATVVLLPGEMPHEYPATMRDLLVALAARNVPIEILRLTMSMGVLRTPTGKQAIFLLGAAMRGVAGEARAQHLAGWRIDVEQTDKLRHAVLKATEENPIDITEFYSWAVEANVEWCQILEDRPEIVERRDSVSPATWWRGKKVAVLGCGAIGSAAAMMLARAGVAEMNLYDRGIVTPGILVRQGFRRDQVGYTKSSALRTSIIGAIPSVKVSESFEDIVTVLRDSEKLSQIMAADVILDATASPTVALAFECYFREHKKEHPPLVAMSLGHNADFAMMTLATQTSPGMSFDLDRRSKIAFANAITGRPFLEEFWPSDIKRRKLFQPEPGCSSPTFRGSYTDVLSLVSRMTNVASVWLAQAGGEPRVYAVNMSGEKVAAGIGREMDHSLRPYRLLYDGRHGYEIRVTPEALDAILSWVRRTERVHGDRVETGGVLFGQVDEFLKVVWIDEVSGPPLDSEASALGFVCGTSGVADLHQEKVMRSGGAIAFVGMWHTHPRGLPIPSATDLGAMERLLQRDNSYRGRNFLMLIVGGTSRLPIVSAGMFERSEYAEQ